MTLLWFLSGASLAILLAGILRSSRLGPPLAPLQDRWPLMMRPFLAPARALSPIAGDLLPPAIATRIRRRLEKADLHPGVDSAQWTSLCISLAATAGICAGLAALLAGRHASIPAVVMAGVAWAACERWLRGRIADCDRRIVRELPACLDLLTVCVEAGATLTAAARFIVEQAPEGPLRNYFDRVLREVRSGRLRAQAFVSVAESYGVECLSTLASALSHAESAGMSIGQVLRTQAAQRSTERFVRAERQAMQAPVKMLGPLIFCIFPCTFIVLAVPIAYHLIEAFRT